jgi:DNA primase
VPREGGDAAHRPNEELYVALERAALYFRQSLSTASHARDYVDQRGLTAETIAKFGIGYAPARWDAIITRYGDTETDRQNLLRAGLIVERNRDAGERPAGSGGHYDRFRDRIMFPIRDTRGRVIAFGGRVLDGSEPKYLNSPETELFHKGRELYALYECRQATRSLSRLLVVEGYMDAVSLHQAGITYAVATLGTATTPDHLQRIFRLVGEVVFCFDGDRAGRAAAWRALENAVSEVKHGRQIRFMFLPDGHDPDSLVRAEGAAAFEARIAGAMPLGEYLLGDLASRVDTASVDGRARLVELARPLLRRIPSDVYRELLTTQLAEAVRMPAARLAGLLEGAETQQDARAATRVALPPQRRRGSAAVTTSRGNLVRQAVGLVVHFPGAARAVNLEEIDALSAVDRPGVPLLIELLTQTREDTPANTAVLLERWRERPDHHALSKLAAAEPLVADEAAAAAELASAIRRLAVEEGPARRLEELLAKARETGLDDLEKSELQSLLKAKGAAGAGSGRAK